MERDESAGRVLRNPDVWVIGGTAMFFIVMPATIALTMGLVSSWLSVHATNPLAGFTLYLLYVVGVFMVGGNLSAIMVRTGRRMRRRSSHGD